MSTTYDTCTHRDTCSSIHVALMHSYVHTLHNAYTHACSYSQLMQKFSYTDNNATHNNPLTPTHRHTVNSSHLFCSQICGIQLYGHEAMHRHRHTVNSSHLFVPHPKLLSTVEMNFHLIMFVYDSRKEEAVVRTPKCCVDFKLGGTVGSYLCLRTTIPD